MAFDYATTLGRVRAFVMDAGSAIWADADLQGAIRIAVGETSLYAGSALTLSGLDGAGSTTVPAALETALIIGSAGYAAAARTADRAENFELAGEADALAAWGSARLRDWRGMLAGQYPNAAAVSDDIAARELAADTRVAARADALSAAEAARVNGLRISGNSAWGAWTDDFGEKDV